MPLDTFYLPAESISYINFPVLRDQQPNIERIIAYTLRMHTALTDYDESAADRIDINSGELQEYIDLCRATCEALGTAAAVPFDALIELRNIQAEMLNVMYLFRSFGNTMFGTPTAAEAEGSGI